MLVVGSFLNGGEVIRLLKRQGNDILIVCAGTRGEPSVEDTVCGGMLVEALEAESTPEAEEAVSLWNLHKENLATMMKDVSEHGRSLVSLGFEADIDFASRQNTYDILAVRDGDSIVRKAQ